MDIQLSVYSDENNRVYKTLTDTRALSGYFRETINVTAPVFEIDILDSDITKYNYAYIPDFKRYYFITGFETFGSSSVRMQLKTDVLMSFKQFFKNCGFIIERSESHFSRNIRDNMLLTKIYRRIETEPFPQNVFTGEHYILTTQGYYDDTEVLE